jgi:phosphatidylglycerophosphatase A
MSEIGAPIIRPSVGFLLAHPAHCIALGFGAGLSPMAPGTAGTLWAWLSFLVLQLWLTPQELGVVVLLSVPLGWWASSVTARHMQVKDPRQIVWDEVAAFWIVLWLVMPAWLLAQAIAFGIGGLAGAAASDVARWIIGSPGPAYASVFALEAALFIVSAFMAARIGRSGAGEFRIDPTTEPVRGTPAPLGDYRVVGAERG